MSITQADIDRIKTTIKFVVLTETQKIEREADMSVLRYFKGVSTLLKDRYEKKKLELANSLAEKLPVAYSDYVALSDKIAQKFFELDEIILKSKSTLLEIEHRKIDIKNYETAYLELKSKLDPITNEIAEYEKNLDEFYNNVFVPINEEYLYLTTSGGASRFSFSTASWYTPPPKPTPDNMPADWDDYTREVFLKWYSINEKLNEMNAYWSVRKPDLLYTYSVLTRGEQHIDLNFYLEQIEFVKQVIISLQTDPQYFLALIPIKQKELNELALQKYYIDSNLYAQGIMPDVNIRLGETYTTIIEALRNQKLSEILPDIILPPPPEPPDIPTPPPDIIEPPPIIVEKTAFEKLLPYIIIGSLFFL